MISSNRELGAEGTPGAACACACACAWRVCACAFVVSRFSECRYWPLGAGGGGGREPFTIPICFRTRNAGRRAYPPPAGPWRCLRISLATRALGHFRRFSVRSTAPSAPGSRYPGSATTNQAHVGVYLSALTLVWRVKPCHWQLAAARGSWAVGNTAYARMAGCRITPVLVFWTCRDLHTAPDFEKGTT
jgi:hypothetical protein